MIALIVETELRSNDIRFLKSHIWKMEHALQAQQMRVMRITHTQHKPLPTLHAEFKS